MATQTPAAETAVPREYGIIASCLHGVQRRLWLTRLTERCTLALACGAAAALPVTAARLLFDRYPAAAWGLVSLPALAAAWALWNSLRGAWHWRIPGTGTLIRMLAVMGILSTLAGALILLLPSLQQHALWIIPAAISAAFVVLAGVTTRPITERTAAIFIDQEAGLQERLATALELIHTRDNPGAAEAAFRQPVVAAAVEACHRARQAKVGYARAGGRLYAAAATAALAAGGISLLTPLPAAARTVRQPYAAVVEKSKKLEQVLNDLEQKKAPENPIAEKKLQPLKNALADLRKGNISPFEADARLTQEKGDLQKSQEEMDASDKVEKALESIKGLEDVARAENQVKSAAMKDASNAGSNAGGKQDAQKAMDQAAKGVADKMKDRTSSQADRDKLAADLEKAAKQAKGDGPLQHSLEQAAEAAKQGDGEKLAQNLGAAGQRMGEQQADQQLSGEAVRQAMEAIDRAGGNQSSSQSSSQNGAAQDESAGGGEQQQGSQNGQQQGSNGAQQGGQQGGQQQGGQQGQEGQNGQGAGSKSGSGQQQGAGQSGSGQASTGGAQGMGSGGSTNLHAPSGPGDHDAGHPLGGTSQYVKVYDEKAIASQGRTEQVSGKINPLGAASGTQQILGQGDKGDPTIQTYESQLPAARKRALDDLQTQQIPPQYRDLIRNYYGQ